jgi:hypothetical protein
MSENIRPEVKKIIDLLVSENKQQYGSIGIELMNYDSYIYYDGSCCDFKHRVDLTEDEIKYFKNQKSSISLKVILEELGLDK